ncbi:MAG: methyltransferase family protein [Planctomycetota bacterium]|jgi:protein-S-isoprenylcysteine O-methyltransferase Ste14
MRSNNGKRVVPGAWFLASIVTMVALDFAVPGVQVIPLPYRYDGGIALILAGLGAAVWAYCLFRRAGTTVEPSKRPAVPVLRGPFRVSRHPMYLGMTVALSGVAVLLGSLSPWVIVPAFFLLVARRFALAEEKVMEEIFGEGYCRYKRRVRRWL